ncbi:hypothetical protein MXD63_44450, partial [Frankia sp. Cpl3]|nr:hypothetical protein [Frankia sp. Cpl3]
MKKFYYVTHASTTWLGAFRPLHTDPYEAITTIITGSQHVRIVGDALLAHQTQHLSVDRVFPGLRQGDTS